MIQSDVLKTIDYSLRGKKGNIDLESFLSFMKRHHPDGLIYPDEIHRELGMEIRDVYDILETCADENIVEQRLSICCPICGRFTGDIYKTALEIPKSVNCVHCNAEINNLLQYAVVVYKGLVPDC